jgi:hypothetical protein
MILWNVMQALGDALKTIDDPPLRVYPYTETRITPPAGMVTLPRTYAYDTTFNRGADDITIPVVVFVGRVDAESSHKRLCAYVDGMGARSVKEVIEKHETTAYDIAHVLNAQFLVMTVASVELLTATFQVRVVGRGQ